MNLHFIYICLIMKKVLILAYDFPPYVSVGGLRPYNWFKYLKEFGVEPIVVTRQWGNEYGNSLDYISPSASKKTLIEEEEYGTVIRAPYLPSFSNRILLKHGEEKYRFFRKALTAIDEIRQFLWVSGPKKQLFLAAEKYLINNKVDAIIATGRPFILFKYVSILSKEYNIPWIADYRDPWSQSSSYRKKYLHRIVSYLYERRITKSSSHITTPSDYFKYRLSKLFPNIDISIIGNGFDPEVADSLTNVSQDNHKLSIALLGTVYPWHPIKSFLSVLTKFVDSEKNSVNLNFYGTNNKQEITNIINESFPILKSMINFYPKMNNKEVLKEMATNNVLLLFNYYAFVGTKIFDYLLVRRQILFCYTNEPNAINLRNKFYGFNDKVANKISIQEDIIKDTNSGLIIKNELHLLETLKVLSKEFRETKSIKCNTRNIEMYSRKKITNNFAELLLKVINERKA